MRIEMIICIHEESNYLLFFIQEVMGIMELMAQIMRDDIGTSLAIWFRQVEV